MSIEEQIEVISTGSVLYASIEQMLDLIQEADMSMFTNSEEEVKTFLRSALEDARSKLRKDVFEARERLENGVKS